MVQVWSKLERVRHGMAYCIDAMSRPTMSIKLYQGSFYSGFSAEPTIDLMKAGLLRVFIVSAGFGVVDGLEPVPSYEAEMKGDVARYWRENDLADIIGQVCISFSPRVVYGFFAGDKAWSSPGTKYRYFFTTGVGLALSAGLKLERAGCFFRKEGKGASAILRALGYQFGEAVKSGFQREPEDMLQGVPAHGSLQVTVAYEEFGPRAWPGG